MALNVNSPDHSDFGLKVEGDLGDLQIIEESSEDDDSGDGRRESPSISTLANIPNSLVKASTTPVFGSVQVTNSDNVQFGNNTFFNGPVTIKQVIQTTTACENGSYQKTDDETIPNGQYHTKNGSLATQGVRFKTWHKLSFSVAGVIVIASICAIVLAVWNKNQQSINNVSENEEFSKNHACDQTLSVVMGCIEYAITILLLTLFMAITILWCVYSLLTNQNEDAYCDRRGQKAETDKQLIQYSDKQRADNILIAPEHLRIVSRTDWLAQPVEEKIDRIRQPVPWVIITHTATGDCFTQSECVLRVRLMQTYHIESKHWSDIGYNFMVGGDGSAYHGRGWDQVGAHTKGYNKYAISIAFIGTFNKEAPNKNQVDACKKLIKLGVAEGKLAKDYILLAHRQVMSTLSPGDKLFDILKTWPHFYNGTDISTIIPKY